MDAEIVTSGTELLLGEIVDTNSTHIARALRDIGVNIYYKTSVGDNVQRMVLVLEHALERADLVIITGGLGPTVDDVTREAAAQATGRELVLFTDCLTQIEAIFARWGRKMGENNRRQAYLPAGSIPIENPVGTAPGFIVEDARGTLIALPGVPREMEHLLQIAVLPYLRQRLGNSQVTIKARVLRTIGLGESWIDERIVPLMRLANPTVGLSAHTGMADIRITARAASEAEADRMIAEVEAQVRARIGNDGIYGTGTDVLEEVTGRLLAQAGVRVALVESATGGEVARLLRGTPEGASVVSAAHVVHTPAELSSLLGISQPMIDAYGWVSETVAAAAARALCDPYETGCGVAVLGDMETENDVYGGDRTGATYVALFASSVTDVRHFPYGGAGFVSRTWVATRTVDLLRREALARLAELADGPH
jgi:nicotinamide-nucleotide amidase